MIVTKCDKCLQEIKKPMYKFNVWEVGKSATRHGQQAIAKGHICKKCLQRFLGVCDK